MAENLILDWGFTGSGLHFRVHGEPFGGFSRGKGNMLYMIQGQGVRDLQGLMFTVGVQEWGNTWKGKGAEGEDMWTSDIFPYVSVMCDWGPSITFMFYSLDLVP